MEEAIQKMAIGMAALIGLAIGAGVLMLALGLVVEGAKKLFMAVRGQAPEPRPTYRICPACAARGQEAIDRLHLKAAKTTDVIRTEGENVVSILDYRDAKTTTRSTD